MLGFLHKRVLCQCHPYLLEALPLSQDPFMHSRTLHTFIDEVSEHHNLYFRSLFGYAHIYNRLTQHIVELPSVEAFQSKLTHLVKTQAEHANERWRQAFEDCSEVLRMCHG